jgi:hypothetical protein
MNGQDQLSLRRDAMLRGLERARTVIPQLAKLDPTLGERLEVRFGQLASEVEDGFEAGPDVACAPVLLKKGEDLIAETIAFLGGAAARSYGLDEGMTSLALVWLDKLSATAGLPKVGVVIPASTEFTGMLTQVVRLKLPSDGVWGLPVAVHEYGHFVASVLQSREDAAGIPEAVVLVERLLHTQGAESELPRLYWHGHELFADAFATAVTGPAHAEYCLRYRFDPAGAHEHTPTHPTPARRMRIQLAVLDALAENDASGLVAGDAVTLRSCWSERLAAAGQDVEVPADSLLDPLERELLELLLDGSSQLKSLRYDRHVVAGRLAESKLELPQKDMSAAHVLNGAWQERRRIEREEHDPARREPQLQRLGQQATRLVQEVLQVA